AAQKELLGWLNSGAQPPITTVAASGTYTVAPFDAPDGLAKALKVPGPNNTYFYIEFRQAVGNDTVLAGNSNLMSGVVLHNYTPGSPSSSYLLNATPGGSFSTPALVVGKKFTDPNTGTTIAPVSVSSSGAVVQVTFGTPVCTHAKPTVTMTAMSGSVAAGTAANFNVTVRN